MMLRTLTLAGLISLSFAGTLRADDQTYLGAGNAAAAATAGGSELVQSARWRIRLALDTISDEHVRHVVTMALFNRNTCVYHRAGLSAAEKQAIIGRLIAAGLLNPDPGNFPGGLLAGVFPPLVDDGTACPRLPQPFYSASGGGQHHAYPGGLAVHEAFNLRSALSFAANYRAAYGYVALDGLPRIGPIGEPISQEPHLAIDQTLVIGTPLMHDWAKAIVFQWNGDGTQFREMGIAGTGGHHTMGIAESIKRNLPPAFVIAQASAHQTPNPDSEPNVVGWIRAACIIDGVDPVSIGMLTVGSDSKLHLPPLRRLGDVDLIAGGETNLLIEDAINNLSDADYVYAEPAVGQADLVLRQLAPQYGYTASDTANYMTKYRNVALSNLGGEHIQIVFANEGLPGVARDLDRLRKKGAI